MSYAEELRTNYRAVRARLWAPPKIRRDVIEVATVPQEVVKVRAAEPVGIGLIIYSAPVGPLPEYREGMTSRQYARWAVMDCAHRHELTVAEILGNQRSRAIVLARHEAIWMVKKNTHWSLPQIGQFFGGRDHTTILHAVRKHEKRLKHRLVCI